MHEFSITKHNTVLITLYEPVQADLSVIGGAKNGYLLDCIFQELDISTGELLFEWHSALHIPLDATYKTREGCSQLASHAFGGCGDHPDAAFDYYHINSVDKDELGNYLVSGRNVFMLSYIDGRSGKVLWNLGGRLNEFEDLSATSFSWQHDARLHNNGTTISLFDNEARAAEDESAGGESCGLVIDVDVEASRRTAKLRHAYCHPHEFLSYSQGNLQIQRDTGNVLIGWGRSAGFTEFSAEGTVLCDARFGAAAWFSFGAVTSYRVFRAEWVGYPSSNPTAVVSSGIIYVSWNGATEVAAWSVEGLDLDEDEDVDDLEELDDEDFEIVTVVSKTGFETEISLLWEDVSYSALRIAAVDEHGHVLGKTPFLTEDSLGREWLNPLTTVYLVLLGAVVGVLATFWIVWRCCGRISPCGGGSSREKPNRVRWQRLGGYEMVDSPIERNSREDEDEEGEQGFGGA
jgi:hypothetical protein